MPDTSVGVTLKGEILYEVQAPRLKLRDAKTSSRISELAIALSSISSR